MTSVTCGHDLCDKPSSIVPMHLAASDKSDYVDLMSQHLADSDKSDYMTFETCCHDHATCSAWYVCD